MAADGSSEIRPDGPGHVRRATAWSRATAARAGVWAHASRDDHASIDIGFRTLERDHRAAAMVLAGGIAYRIFFWVLAVSIVLGGVLGLIDPSDVQATLENHGFGVWAAAAIARLAGSADGNEWWLLLTGVYLVLWTGYTSTKALVLTHAAIWRVQPPKVRRPLHASLVFNGLTFGFIAAVALARWLREQNSSAGFAATLLVIAVPFVFWVFASRALPNRARSWVDVAPGAAVLAVGLQAMHLFTTYFLGPKLANATQLYGVLGVTTTILFWFYLAGRLIIAAAILNTSFVEHGETTDSASTVAPVDPVDAPRRGGS